MIKCLIWLLNKYLTKEDFFLFFFWEMNKPKFLLKAHLKCFAFIMSFDRNYIFNVILSLLEAKETQLKF